MQTGSQQSAANMPMRSSIRFMVKGWMAWCGPDQIIFPVLWMALTMMNTILRQIICLCTIIHHTILGQRRYTTRQHCRKSLECGLTAESLWSALFPDWQIRKVWIWSTASWNRSAQRMYSLSFWVPVISAMRICSDILSGSTRTEFLQVSVMTIRVHTEFMRPAMHFLCRRSLSHAAWVN